jgi:SAM-dependent methyltransferase
MTFESISYSRHAAEYEADLTDSSRSKRANSWFDKTTADYWRHARAYECVECLTDNLDASWLTVGDGRWGLDSIRIGERGFLQTLPTNIGETLLKEAKEKGLIKDYRVENAERLSFQNKQFDYVFCKESFHHFPRPYLAIYEMLRVARKAVFLIEPNDAFISKQPNARLSKRFLLRLPGQIIMGIVNYLRNKPACVYFDDQRHPTQLVESALWESAGNYAYTISRAEAEKIALGINLPQLAFKYYNDFYIENCEFEPADQQRSKIFREIIQNIQVMDTACEAGVRAYNFIMIGFFLEPMTTTARDAFERRKWTVLDLPTNPYIANR